MSIIDEARSVVPTSPVLSISSTATTGKMTIAEAKVGAYIEKLITTKFASGGIPLSNRLLGEVAGFINKVPSLPEFSSCKPILLMVFANKAGTTSFGAFVFQKKEKGVQCISSTVTLKTEFGGEWEVGTYVIDKKVVNESVNAPDRSTAVKGIATFLHSMNAVSLDPVIPSLII